MSDARPLVVGEGLFANVVAQEIHKALRLQYPFSVITIVGEHSPAAAPDPLTHADFLVGSVGRVIRSADVIGLLAGQPAVRVLLIGADLEASEGVIARIHDELPRDRSVRFGLACFPATATTSEEVLSRADADAGLTTH